MPPKKPKYTHLSQRNQILKRPGQHIGSVKNSNQAVWVAQTEIQGDSEIERISQQEINYNPGLVHLFYEVLGNAQDNYFRSKDSEAPLKKIDVSVDQESGEVTVWNDGLWIPATLHDWDDGEEIIDNGEHYEAEIIFGNLNSSSNYNDEDDEENKRIGGGLHGVGVKLTNIFSSEFSVEAFDPELHLKFIGNWTENMSNLNTAKVVSCKQKKGYTKITYTADFARFGVKGYSDEIVSVMKKLCMDCAMITGQKVYFNGDQMKVKDLSAYVNYYTDGKKIEFKSEDTMVVVCEKSQYDAGLTQISWVNGINTIRGGVHVDEWKKAIFGALLEKIRIKFGDKFKITPKQLEQYFMIFVNCNLENPEFDGQTKGVLSSPSPTVDVKPAKITAMMKWDFVEDLDETFRIQGMKELKKTDGKKTASVKIPKVDDANKAGTAKSGDCTLFIVEGGSAKEFAVKGIAAIEDGTDWFGVLPIRGKFINVRDMDASKINANKEITDLKKLLGLQHGLDYEDDKAFNTLRYGKVRVLTDADPDGDHIKGLLINFFQYFYPSLLARGYISGLRTPIVRATLGKKVLTFYYLKDYKSWAEKQTKKYTVKYYKGLGTSNDEEIMEIFTTPRYVQFVADETTDGTVSMVFNKKRADERKKWLGEYKSKEFSYKEKSGEEQVPISQFFNNEMIAFSIYDNQRSIPSVVDGLKPSQRKIMWAALQLLNTKDDYKVAQFAARVAEMSEYHHGEKSLENTVVGMAQTFVGANNVALLAESGQFGSRLDGGKSFASPRYIFTHLTDIARYILRKEDDPILDYLEEEGKQIEPKFFVPIIPLFLANGSKGIGTGWSTDTPAYNPLDLVKWIKAWLADEKLPELTPWYMGFKGRTEKTDPKHFVHYGKATCVGNNCFEVNELPVGVWSDDYKDLLTNLQNTVSSKQAKGYEAMNVAQLKTELQKHGLPVSGTKKILVSRMKKHDKDNGIVAKKAVNANQIVSKWEWKGDPYHPRFLIWTKPGVVIDCDNDKFKLTSKESLTNMTAFTPEGGLKKYDTLEEVLTNYCVVRFDHYDKRKKHLLGVLKERLAQVESKERFVQEVLTDFDILKQTVQELWDHFEKAGYWKKTDYSYLTDMQIKTFTVDHHQKLLEQINEIKAEINYIKKTTPSQMWTNELDEFVKQYSKWKICVEEQHEKLATQKIKIKGRQKGKK